MPHSERRSPVWWALPLTMILGALPLPARAATDVYPFTPTEIGKDYKFGLGVELGTAFTGLTMNIFSSQYASLQFGVGYFDPPKNLDFTVGVDSDVVIKTAFIGYPDLVQETETVTVPFYMGIGLSFIPNAHSDIALMDFDDLFQIEDVKSGGDILAVTVPIGVAFLLRDAPMSFYFQAEPGIDILVDPTDTVSQSRVVPSTRLSMGGSIYFF